MIFCLFRSINYLRWIADTFWRYAPRYVSTKHYIIFRSFARVFTLHCTVMENSSFLIVYIYVSTPVLLDRFYLCTQGGRFIFSQLLTIYLLSKFLISSSDVFNSFSSWFELLLLRFVPYYSYAYIHVHEITALCSTLTFGELPLIVP